MLAQNFFYPLSHWALLAAKSEGVPIRTFIHGNVLCPDDASEIVRIGSRVHARTLGRWQLRNAGPVAISRSSRDFIAEEFGVDAPVIPLPIPDIPRAEQTTGPHGDEPARIIFVGRLVDLKGPIEALEAASILSRHRPVQLEFFGDGPLRDELERRAPDWVVVHGQRARQDVLRALSRAHCFLSASVTDNAQTSLLEAIVMGVPSVATAVGDAPDYLAGPMSRLCVPAYDIDGLAAALRTATDDWNRWSSLARVRGDELRARHATGAVLGQIEKLLGAADVSRRTNAA